MDVTLSGLFVKPMRRSLTCTVSRQTNQLTNSDYMKNLFSFILLLVLSLSGLQAQTIEELKAQKADLVAKQKEAKAAADAFNGDIGALSKQIELLSGWQTGLTGLLGMNLNNSSNWQANANRNSSSSTLNLGVNAFANNIKEKTFWRNTLTTNISWQGLDNDTKDDMDGSGFLENRNGDVFIASSLFGLRFNKDFAGTALADLNTSVFNFLSPGTADIGIGGTWTPSGIPNLVVVAHPTHLPLCLLWLRRRGEPVGPRC